MKTQYIICDTYGSVRIESALCCYADSAYVQTYVDPEAAQRAADMLNDEFNGFLVKDGKLVKSRPWTVWEMKPVVVG